jgi:hypothetical protein
MRAIWNTITGALSTFAASWQSYLAAAGLCLVLGLGAGFYAGHRWEQAALEKHMAADAKAMAKATTAAATKQHRLDLSGQAAAIDEAYFRGKLDGTIIQLKSGAPANVTITQDQEAAAADRAGCITYGFYRMLAAGERGVAADTLPLPAGQSVDACTAVVPSELAAAAAQDLADGVGNAEQLTALLGEINKQQGILGASK